MKNRRVLIKNKEEFRRLQEYLFSKGYKWWATGKKMKMYDPYYGAVCLDDDAMDLSLSIDKSGLTVYYIVGPQPNNGLRKLILN